MSTSNAAVSHEAEVAVLACCLKDPAILKWLELDADHFADPRNRTVWSAMQGLAGDSIDTDLVFLEDALRKAGKLEAIGGLSYLVELADTACYAPSVAKYADLLRDALVARRALDLAEEIGLWVQRGASGGELLDDIGAAVRRLDGQKQSAGKTVQELIRDESRAVEAYLENAGKMPGVSTGIRRLDEITGGIPLGIPSILAARPREGKSSLALQIAKNATFTGDGVHWFANEDGADTFAQRWWANESGVAASSIRARKLNRGELSQLEASTRAIRTHKGLLWEQASGQGAQWIIRRILGEQRRNNTRLVVVDLLARVTAPDRGMSLRDRIGANLEALASCAAQNNFALLLLAHTKRGAGDEPSLDDLAESDFLGRDGKLILMLRPRGADGLDIWVVKNHQGEEGLIPCSFDKARCRIRG